MLTNRSMPDDVLIPVLAYPDVPEAIAWLEKAFGFRRRWATEDRAQVAVGESAAITLIAGPPPSSSTDLVMVRVDRKSVV